MRTLSKPVRIFLVGAAGLIVVAVLLRAQTPPSSPCDLDRHFVVVIKSEHAFKTDEKSFDAALDSLGANVFYKIKKKDSLGREQIKQSKNVSLNTVNVTNLALAQSSSTGEYTSIGTNVTQQIASNDVGDIIAVLNQLK